MKILLISDTSCDWPPIALCYHICQHSNAEIHLTQIKINIKNVECLYYIVFFFLILLGLSYIVLF